MSAVIQPEVFDRAHFATPGYRAQAEEMLKGMKDNCLVISDPNRRLLTEITDRILSLSTKDGQQLQIKWTELKKNNPHRVMIADESACRCSLPLTLLETATVVHNALRTDTLIVEGNGSNALPAASGHQANSLTPLGVYTNSDFECRRRYLLNELPDIDELKTGEFDDLMIQLTRFAKRLRFYDKQIGKGGNIRGFRDGIGRILKLWTTNAQ